MERAEGEGPRLEAPALKELEMKARTSKEDGEDEINEFGENMPELGGALEARERRVLGKKG